MPTTQSYSVCGNTCVMSVKPLAIPKSTISISFMPFPIYIIQAWGQTMTQAGPITIFLAVAKWIDPELGPRFSWTDHIPSLGSYLLE